MSDFLITYTDESGLEHHGVLGQKWGVKNGPPYPLDADDHSSSEKKAGWHRSLSKEQKIAIGLAGALIGSAAVYALAKSGKLSFDTVIDAGASLQRIGNDAKLGEVFYASMGKHDNKRYEGLLGFQRTQQGWNPEKLQLKANKQIKVASEKNAKKVYRELQKQGLYPSDLSYREFNADKIIRDANYGKPFFNEMEKKGYGAIVDINDKYNSGYNARKPLIFFGEGGKNVEISGRSKISNLNKKQKIEMGKALAEQVLKENGDQLAITSAGAGTLTALAVVDSIVYPESNDEENSK